MDELTTSQAAPLLKISRLTVVRWCQAGRFPGAYLPGRSRRIGYRIPRASVLALLEEEELAALQERVSA
jgi:excisionase family DNA binding protein